MQICCAKSQSVICYIGLMVFVRATTSCYLKIDRSLNSGSASSFASSIRSMYAACVIDLEQILQIQCACTRLFYRWSQEHYSESCKLYAQLCSL